jgi:hypothetical protein
MKLNTRGIILLESLEVNRSLKGKHIHWEKIKGIIGMPSIHRMSVVSREESGEDMYNSGAKQHYSCNNCHINLL